MQPFLSYTKNDTRYLIDLTIGKSTLILIGFTSLNAIMMVALIASKQGPLLQKAMLRRRALILMRRLLALAA